MTSRHGTDRRVRDRQAGLTLIEVLVVIAVIGVATGATMMGLNGADRGARAQSEAVRLSRQLTLAVDEAMISGLALQLVWDADGYSFQQWQKAGDGWGPASVPGLAMRHDIRAPLQMGMAGDGGAVLIAASGSGPARQILFAGVGVPWTVGFDGFTALAGPQEPA
ncbi:type II secretion system protein GspH [Paracoccus liaowanqingii]|uniref:Type II secretion system protein GspH n=1 Tax=Paracoccus liaowanqingii TaxID=2560053 RepID=A0A4Z1CQY5_9RHOB|nr:type II secretion system protein GspH [Paracoccus liaowanqingii]TGN67555.1 type II secretion system protein GspH [Paracoccus liaowanqingii]